MCQTPESRKLIIEGLVQGVVEKFLNKMCSGPGEVAGEYDNKSVMGWRNNWGGRDDGKCLVV